MLCSADPETIPSILVVPGSACHIWTLRNVCPKDYQRGTYFILQQPNLRYFVEDQSNYNKCSTVKDYYASL